MFFRILLEVGFVAFGFISFLITVVGTLETGDLYSPGPGLSFTDQRFYRDALSSENLFLLMSFEPNDLKGSSSLY